jgi:hypothetical protein
MKAQPPARQPPALSCGAPHCRDDDELTPDRSHKPIPGWARPQAVLDAIKAQRHKDPDAIFGATRNTCDLTDMFKGGWGSDWSLRWSGVLQAHVPLRLCLSATTPLPDVPAGSLQPQQQRTKMRKLGERTSSAEWSQDRLTWQEEITYKKELGYL